MRVLKERGQAFLIGIAVGMFSALPIMFFMLAYITFIPKSYDCFRQGYIEGKTIVLCEDEHEAFSFIEKTHLQFKAFRYRLEEIMQ